MTFRLKNQNEILNRELLRCKEYETLLEKLKHLLEINGETYNSE